MLEQPIEKRIEALRQGGATTCPINTACDRQRVRVIKKRFGCRTHQVVLLSGLVG